MEQSDGTEIWENPSKDEIDAIIEDGLKILKKDIKKAVKEFELFIRNRIGEKAILG